MARMRACKSCDGLIFESASPMTAEWLHVHRADADRCPADEAEPKPAGKR